MAWESGNEEREFCMRIGDYVAGKRERLNDGARGIGNRICGGLGDVLASDISPRRALSVGLVGLAIGGGVSSGGCTNNPLVNYATLRVLDNAINSGEGEENNQGNGSYVISRPKPVIEMREWRDNGDMMDQPNELSEDTGSSFNISEVGIRVNIPYWARKPQIVSYTIFDSNKNVFFTRDCSQEALILYRGHPMWSPGKYTIKAEQGNDIRLLREFEITR